MNIAVVRLSAIGDCCLVLPTVKILLEQIKNAQVYWLIDHAAYQVLKFTTHPRLRYIVINKPKKIADYRAIKRTMSDKNIDVLLAMQANTRVNFIYPCIKAKRKIGFDKARARELQGIFTREKIAFKKEHLADSFAQFAEILDLDVSNLDFSIELDPDASLPELPEKYVVINPAASKLERSWFSENYANIASWIGEVYQVPVVLTGAPSAMELELAREIGEGSKNIINLVGKTNLQQLALVLKNAEAVIAPDTGPAHIANAVGTPVIGLYAVVTSKLSRPYNYPELVIDKFEMAVKEFLQKDPKTVSWKTRVHDRRAMTLIKESDVQEKLYQLLGKERF